ncbi:DUF4132 domain-containing protein [Neobacillus sp. NPDC058068]|uniref:DUF4132 domain-containing protein n=1 Tax=Neobacillus sp. NPDC058068 TaxID=3346325 RepID=UPI0036DDBA08
MKTKDRHIYYSQLEAKAAAKLTETQQNIALQIIKLKECNYLEKEEHLRTLKRALIEQNDPVVPKSFQPLVEIVRTLLGPNYGGLFQYIIDHKCEYPYSTGYERRPFRTKNMEYHIDGIINALIDIIELDFEDFSPLDYLTSRDESTNYYAVISDFIAYELDRNNEQVFQALKEIIFGDNNTALLTSFMIKGIFKSHQQEGYKMLGDLLIAARLQEGLRQSIVESMDEGVLEATIYMVEIITANDLIRYSSVLRALNVWTGLNLETSNKRVAIQLIDDVSVSLTNPEIRLQGLNSENLTKLYISLWATAVQEEEDVRETVQFLMENGMTYQKITAQYFLTQSQNTNLKFSLSSPYLHESNQELQNFLVQNYHYEGEISWSYYSEKNESTMTIERVPVLEDKHIRTQHFEQFMNMLVQMPKKEISIESKAIQGLTIIFSTDEIARKLMFLIAYDMDHEWLAQLIKYKDKLSSELREILLTFFIKDITDKVQREFLFASLSDRSVTIRETALSRIKSIELFVEEIEKIEAILTLKTGALRQSAIQILLKLPNENLEPTIERLLNSRHELQKTGAIELLTEIKGQPVHAAIFNRFKTKIKQVKTTTAKEQILINKLFQMEEYSLKNGFGLFDPNRTANIHLEYPKIDLIGFLSVPIESIKQFLQGLANLVHEHRHVEYEAEWFDGSKETVHVGEYLRWPHSNNDSETIHDLPLAEVWQEYFNNHNLTADELIQAAFYLHSDRIYSYYYQFMEVWEVMEYPRVEGWRKGFLAEIFPIEKIAEMNRYLYDFDYRSQVITIFDAYFESQNSKEIFGKVSAVLNFMIHAIPKEYRKSEFKLYDFICGPWLEWTKLFADDDERFDVYFKLQYQLFSLTDFVNFHSALEDLIKAFQRNIIDEQIIFQELLMRGDQSRYQISELTNPKSEILKKFPFMDRFKNLVVERILEIELTRGDLPTEVTTLASGIERFAGMEYFVKILIGLEKESFVRGYIYSYGRELTKKEIFSQLLKVCQPNEGEDKELLNRLLNGKKISEQRLLEAAMYAPRWLELVGEFLQWEGLQSTAWYFHAHMNETFSAEKETNVARYSPISPQDFQDGAFDIEWFKESYEQLGEEKFQLLYHCAKYISGGANHRRSQLFADAVLGKLDLEKTANLVREKRMKDQVLCYSLIPVNNNEDVLERYEFLQRFFQESKKFGAQRRASEAKTVVIALDNLARNAGYKDVTRLKWDMEAKKMEEIIPYLEPKVIDDLTLQLVIDANGRSEILAVKNDKPLKSVPGKYSKHEYVVRLKDKRAELRDQYKRAKAELERSMELENGFTLKEVSGLRENPVLAPLLTSLVFKVGNHLGYFDEGALKEVGTGERYTIQPYDELFIAHPIHLYESGQWSCFQRDLFTRKMKQPFKQVFRELFLANQDELAAVMGSKRYAGQQIQPKKTVALLKSRMWTVSYEEGLQKVYYKDNIVVKLFALADWFSPSDVECPTLETVEFFDRKTDKPLAVRSIPKLIFSETMRDIDLVVSIAHVGGVDPEASLTTIELRKAIVAESIRLMKLDNVKLEGNFALITGSLGEYSVHLGSANVYKQATGAIFIVPVHSQHRGRIFLPFMDEDPKTAEIVSKILLLAEDKKIKDPYILEQIKK